MVPKTKVFIGSLPPGSKPDELRRLFETYGTVTECDVMNRCGFVHMQTEEMAVAAIKALNNTQFKGATISVERGRIKERGAGGPRGQGGRGPSGGFGNRSGGFGNRNGSGGPRNGRMGMGGPRRGGPGGPMRGGPRENRGAPYSRDGGRDFDRRGGGPMRNGVIEAFDRQMNFAPMNDRGLGGPGMMDGRGGGPGMMNRRNFNDGPGGFSGEDRRGFALPRGGGGPGGPGGPGGFMDDRRQQMGGMDDRRGGAPPMGRPPMPMPPMFDRRPAPNMGGNGGDMFSRRSPPQMRGGFGGGDRNDSYSQAFPPLGGPRNQSGPAGRRDNMPQRRF